MTELLHQGPVPVEPKELTPNQYDELRKNTPKSKLCDHEMMQILIDRERLAQDNKLADDAVNKARSDYKTAWDKYMSDYVKYYGSDEG